ncbi:TPA: hypothetical protein EYN98_08695 [Candidatus Poribacteria bacterium]|nr:hypothetical protein [Candidatus Poribacteria bacterium]HIA66129.1 hypothetical protein [Candidatus Poribacteria bacterium]HIB88895.1 hypothetical protein [Candidatus Poribacteria bacterium]HIC01435.1 hypothetical protein [Candidatus Poribacteria bacterium]HIM10915.1 hypothetical protein [Candidatus Poribacteria bacterium]
MKKIEALKGGITLRALLLSAILIPLNCYWLIELEVVRYTTPTWVVPLSNVLFFILVLILLNIGLKNIHPRMALRQSELMGLYVMLSIASTLCSHDIMERLMGTITHGLGLATPENDWKALFGKDLPIWLTVQDDRILEGYYQGDATFYRRNILLAWSSPVLWWTGFMIVLSFVMISVSVLVRKQWTERERLTYPIIQLPLEMTSEMSLFFQSRVMWLGFAIAAGISILNGLHHFWPILPSLPITRQHYRFSDRPLSLFGTIIIAFYPFAIGLGFLMPIDLLFSTIIFYGLYRGQAALGKMIGWHLLPDFPYRSEQSFGGFVGIMIYLLWIGSGHLKYIFSRDSSKGEPLSYRFVILGAGIGLLLLASFVIQIGMAVKIAVIFFAIYLMVAIIITRMRAEAGIFVHNFHHTSPIMSLINILGSQRLGQGNLITFALLRPFNHGFRAHLMPHQLESYQIALKTQSHSVGMIGAILWATFLGAISTFWIQLHLYYKHGAASGYFHTWRIGSGTFRLLEGWLTYPGLTNWSGVAFMGGGLLLTIGMILMRLRFFWWPLHPLGYVMSTNGEMSDLWAVIIISFVLKWAILKYGGLKAHRKALPFFLGLILGDYTMGSLWNILSIALDTTIYQFYP